MELHKLPKDLVNLFLGIVHENAKKEIAKKSCVYMLIHSGTKQGFTTAYFSKDLVKIKNIIKTSVRSLDYCCFYVNPDIESDGVYVFRRSGEILKLTVNEEEAVEFRRKFNFEEPIENYFHKYEPESYDEFLYKID